MQKDFVLQAQDVVKTFVQAASTITVLNGVTAQFKQGSTYAITGASGAGKSTLLHMLAGIDVPTSGAVFYNGHNIATISEHEKNSWLNTKVGLIFQQPYLINELTVLENVMIKGLIQGLPPQQCAHKAHILLAKVGLVDKADSKPATLSGGQQARVSIARALLNEPVFLLADEPTGNLDEAIGKEIVELLIECQNLWKMGLIISSHDSYVSKRMETVLRLQGGLLVELA